MSKPCPKCGAELKRELTYLTTWKCGSCSSYQSEDVQESKQCVCNRLEQAKKERDAALEREKWLREALSWYAESGEPGTFSVVDENREFITDFASFGNRARAALYRPGEQEEAIIVAETQPQEKIDCPRAKSDMTPCVARDGKTACADDGRCVGCGEHPADLLMDLVQRYVKQKEALQQLSAPPVTVRDVPQSEVDGAEKPVSTRQFRAGDRVRVREDCDDSNWLRSTKGYHGQIGVVVERDDDDPEWPVGVEIPGQTELVCFTDGELELAFVSEGVEDESAGEANPENPTSGGGAT